MRRVMYVCTPLSAIRDCSVLTLRCYGQCTSLGKHVILLGDLNLTYRGADVTPAWRRVNLNRFLNDSNAEPVSHRRFCSKKERGAIDVGFCTKKERGAIDVGSGATESRSLQKLREAMGKRAAKVRQLRLLFD